MTYPITRSRQKPNVGERVGISMSGTFPDEVRRKRLFKNQLPVLSLHKYRYLDGDYLERERITRKLNPGGQGFRLNLLEHKSVFQLFTVVMDPTTTFGGTVRIQVAVR